MRLEREPWGPAALLRAAGELGPRDMAALRAAITEALDGGAHQVVVDMSRVEHIDYVTLGVLVERAARARALGGGLMLSGCSPYLQDILRFAGVHLALPTAESPGAAFAALGELAVAPAWVTGR